MEGMLGHTIIKPVAIEQSPVIEVQKFSLEHIERLKKLDAEIAHLEEQQEKLNHHRGIEYIKKDVEIYDAKVVLFEGIRGVLEMDSSPMIVKYLEGREEMYLDQFLHTVFLQKEHVALLNDVIIPAYLAAGNTVPDFTTMNPHHAVRQKMDNETEEDYIKYLDAEDVSFTADATTLQNFLQSIRTFCGEHYDGILIDVTYKYIKEHNTIADTETDARIRDLIKQQNALQEDRLKSQEQINLLQIERDRLQEEITQKRNKPIISAYAQTEIIQKEQNIEECKKRITELASKQEAQLYEINKLGEDIKEIKSYLIIPAKKEYAIAESHIQDLWSELQDIIIEAYKNAESEQELASLDVYKKRMLEHIQSEDQDHTSDHKSFNKSIEDILREKQAEFKRQQEVAQTMERLKKYADNFNSLLVTGGVFERYLDHK